MLPGPATLRNLGRYSAYHEKTVTRWDARDFDFVSLNKAAIIEVIPPTHAQALVIDASFLPTSGKQPDGLDRFWNGRHRRPEKGLESSALAWLASTANCAYGLSVAQTPPADKTTGAEAIRIAVYLAPVARVVSAHHLRHRRDVITDGYDRTQKCLRGVRALGREPIGQLRLDAHLRSLYQGPQRSGPGRPQTSDGTVHWDNLSRFAKVETNAEAVVRDHQVLNPVQCQCNLCVVLVVDPTHHRHAVLLSTDRHVDALTIYHDDTARCPIACLFRDAKQFAGLTDCQARSHAKLNVHFHASRSAVTFATLEARPQRGDAASGFSMASLKRRAFNQQLIERSAQCLAQGHSLDKSSPDDEELCTYGTITETAA
jgi:hypothetical protein